MNQPKVTDFTTVVGICPPGKPLEYQLRMKLASRWVTVGIHSTREKAETAEVAINQAMIEYRTRRNQWATELVTR